MAEKRLNYHRLRKEVNDWQKETFKAASPLTYLEQLRREMKELEDELSNDLVDVEAVRMEVADLEISLMGLVDRLGIGDPLPFVNKKLKINKSRKWGPPDGEFGVQHHIE